MATYYDDERNIIQLLHDSNKFDCVILSKGILGTIKTLFVLGKVSVRFLFDKRWENNTTSNTPPDFISSKGKYMMEIMRFDDHSKDGKKNPTLARESDIYEQIKPILNNSTVYISAHSGLPAEKDHNYNMYYNGFKRTVSKHISKIPNYRENHPKAKCIFFVFDESSGIYVEGNGNDNQGIPHKHFIDKKFIDVFKDSDVDYLIWFAPYKSCFIKSKIRKKLFRVSPIAIYDVKKFMKNRYIRNKIYNYNENKMISSEK